MAEQQNSPFARVANGYDPKQVAAFAAEALSWKKELTTLRTEVAAAVKLVERYESVIGSIEEVEHEAAQIVDDAERRSEALLADAEARASKIVEEAENEAARILEMAQDQGVPPVTEPVEREPEVADGWLAPEPDIREAPDPVEQIFEPTEEVSWTDEVSRTHEVSPSDGISPTEVDVSLERRAARAANLWKRRGLVAPSE